MVNKHFAREQAGRFSGLDGFPGDVRGVNEIVKACQHASTEAVLLGFADDWIRYNVKAPKPSQIMEKLYEAGQKMAAALSNCEACGGSGYVQMRGVNRFDGSIVDGVKTCRCRELGQPIRHEDSCSRCHGHGIFGGELHGQYAGPWKWCPCVAGLERQEREPECVELSNAAREKLLRRFGPKPLKSMVGQLADDYHGDF